MLGSVATNSFSERTCHRRSCDVSLNVLQLIGSFHQGGSERQAVQLTGLLLADGRYNVSVATLERDGMLLERMAELGFTDIPEFRLTSFYDSNAAKQWRRFRRFLVDGDIAVVHAHDFYTNVFGMFGAAAARVPVRIAARRESAVRSGKQRFVERSAYRLAQAVVANCDEVKQQLIQEGVPATKIQTVYNGVDLAKLAAGTDSVEEIRRSFGLPSLDQFVTIVANMRVHIPGPEPVCLKDHPTFLRAAQRVLADLPNTGFIIAGEGDLKHYTEEFARELGIADRVFFTGRCERVSDVLKMSDVCVLSSISEGFSNSILEYMAASKPVVATDVGGAREAVAEGESGYIVKARDYATMAERILSLLHAPDRARVMGARGRALVEEKFSCAAQLNNTLNLYDRLLRKGGLQPGNILAGGADALVQSKS
jgi:glycosyltransferase involved in cell wall biosynthesis